MRLFLGITVFVASIVLSDAQKADQNPCHPSYVKNEAGAMECEQIALPDAFCSTCRMSQFNASGVFPDCKRTMELSRPCMSKLQEYVNLNPCDTNRATHLKNYLTSTDPLVVEDARLRLDWFAFSICEQGCDCIPQIDADRSTPAFDFARGNCQAHAYHHICKLMPNIKLVRLNDGKPHQSVDHLPPPCDKVNEWFRSTDAINWSTNPETTVDADVARFLDGFMRGKQFLELKDFWNQCFDLELAQKRVEQIDRPPPVQKAPVPIKPIQKAPPPPLNLAVISFSLMKAGTRKVLVETIDDEAVIDLAKYGTDKVSIRANVVGTNKAKSIRFELDGNRNYKMENARPYSISGDSRGRFKPWNYQDGKQYTLKGTPYTGRSGNGKEGQYREIRFTLKRPPAPVVKPKPAAPKPVVKKPPPVPAKPKPTPAVPATVKPPPIKANQPLASIPAAVVSFSLIDARSNRVIIQKIQDDDTIDLSGLSAAVVNVRANTVGDDPIGSVRFDLNGKINYRTENVAPWALAGDIDGDYIVWKYAKGRKNTIVATPFEGMLQRGRKGKPMTIHFTLV